jgi:hypothetical protein
MDPEMEQPTKRARTEEAVPFLVVVCTGGAKVRLPVADARKSTTIANDLDDCESLAVLEFFTLRGCAGFRVLENDMVTVSGILLSIRVCACR